MKPEREPKEGRARQMEMKRNHAEKCRERRRRQVPEQTWQRARQALKDRGLRIFIIIFFNLGLSEEKGQLRKGEGRGNYSSYSVTTPEGENTGYTRSINLCRGGVRRRVTCCVYIISVSTVLCQGLCRSHEWSGCAIFSCVFIGVNV